MADAPHVPLQKFLDQASTGDVVLWAGTSWESLGVEILSGSVFSHASMVIVDPTTGQKCLYQSVSEELGPDPLVGGTTHAGAQAGDLAAIMKEVYGYGDFPVWRRYSGASDPGAFNKQVWGIAGQMDGTPFPSSPWEMAALLVMGREANQEVLTPLFCSGLVAYVLQTAGVIARTSPCNGYFPKDFSSEYPGHFEVLQGSYADDVLIDMT